MVESTNNPEVGNGNLAPNVAQKDLAQMSEYERRLARAARYGLDPAKVVGPQIQIAPDLKPEEAFNRMA